MKKFIEFYVSKHDPMLGIDSQNIAPTLSECNWQKKALIKQEDSTSVYVYISIARCLKERKPYYCLNYYDIEQQLMLSQELFATPTDALAKLN